MGESNERVFYRNGSTVITDTRATIGGQTYDLRNAAAVSVMPPTLRRWMGSALLAVGLLLLAAGYFVGSGVLLIILMLGGAVLVIAGVALYRLAHEQHTVTITSHDGQQDSLQFSDASQAQRVVAAISNVIRKTG